MKIYIVDDSKAIGDRLAEIFREKIKSVKIQTAEDIDEVKVHLEEFSPHVVIIDIHLKKGSGFDVLELIRQKRMSPLILVLTNYALPPYKEKAFKLGVDYFFDKSQNFNEAVAVVEKYSAQLPIENGFNQ